MAGWTNSLALLSSGAVVAWGNDSEGQLGLGNSGLGARQVTPQLVQGGGANSAIAIAAGAWHSLALLSNGSVKSWGWNGASNITTPQLMQWFCLSLPGSYAMQFGMLGATTLSMSIPCNAVAGPSPPYACYSCFNAFSLVPQNATSPGTGPWYGLHTTQTEVLRG